MSIVCSRKIGRRSVAKRGLVASLCVVLAGCGSIQTDVARGDAPAQQTDDGVAVTMEHADEVEESGNKELAETNRADTDNTEIVAENGAPELTEEEIRNHLAEAGPPSAGFGDPAGSIDCEWPLVERGVSPDDYRCWTFPRSQQIQENIIVGEGQIKYLIAQRRSADEADAALEAILADPSVAAEVLEQYNSSRPAPWVVVAEVATTISAENLDSVTVVETEGMLVVRVSGVTETEFLRQ